MMKEEKKTGNFIKSLRTVGILLVVFICGASVCGLIYGAGDLFDYVTRKHHVRGVVTYVNDHSWDMQAGGNAYIIQYVEVSIYGQSDPDKTEYHKTYKDMRYGFYSGEEVLLCYNVWGASDGKLLSLYSVYYSIGSAIAVASVTVTLVIIHIIKARQKRRKQRYMTNEWNGWDETWRSR